VNDPEERKLFEGAYCACHTHRTVKDNAYLLRRDPTNPDDYAKFEVQKSWEIWQICATRVKKDLVNE
jgi:hypothetical protein